MGNNATINDFLTNAVLDLLNSTSSEPSNTIRIRPRVPSMGKSPDNSGTSIPKNTAICFTAHPKSSNKITDGIFVLDDEKSNKYASNNNPQNVIIMLINSEGYFELQT